MVNDSIRRVGQLAVERVNMLRKMAFLCPFCEPHCSSLMPLEEKFNRLFESFLPLSKSVQLLKIDGVQIQRTFFFALMNWKESMSDSVRACEAYQHPDAARSRPPSGDQNHTSVCTRSNPSGRAFQKKKKELYCSLIQGKVVTYTCS